MKFTLKEIIFIGIFAAITAILAQISIPIPFSPVPLTLSILGVFFSAIFLGLKCGTFSQIVYILLGLFGVPVFTGFTSGVNYKIGYILSYPLIAFVIGLFINRKKDFSILNLIGIMLIGLSICYTMGATGLAIFLKYDAAKAITIGVIPFLPLDIFKIIAAAIIGSKVRTALKKSNLI